MPVEAGHIQLTEYRKTTIPYLNWMFEDLFCRYDVSIPYYLLDFSFPDYPLIAEWPAPYSPEWLELYKPKLPDWPELQYPDWFTGGFDWFPEFNGFNFNMDWGEWGYDLAWLNELLGLLFDAANLPRQTLPDLSDASISLLNNYFTILYEGIEEEEEDEYLYMADYANDRIVIVDLDLNLIGTFNVSDQPYSITVDSEYIYLFCKGVYPSPEPKLYKYNISSPYSLVATSSALSDYSRYDDLDCSGNYIYAAYTIINASGHTQSKNIAIIKKSDLSIDNYFLAFSGTANYTDGIVVDDNYIYASDAGAKTIKKFNKSTHNLIDSGTTTASFEPYRLGQDSTYIYSTGILSYANIKLWKKSDLSIYKNIDCASITRYAQDIAINGAYLYVGDTSSSNVIKKVVIDTGVVISSYEGVKPYGLTII